jgi:hypothetical protein
MNWQKFELVGKKIIKVTKKNLTLNEILKCFCNSFR